MIKWFSFEWLKSEERRELEALRKEKEQLLKEKQEIVAELGKVIADAKAKATPSSQDFSPYQRPTPVGVFKKAIYSNGVITVITHQDISLSKMNVDLSFVNKIQQVKSEKELFALMADPAHIPNIQTEEVSKEDKMLVANSLDALKNHKDFVVTGNQVMMKGVGLAMPEVVTASFIEIIEKGQDQNMYNALKMFWLKLALNAIPQSREDLLTFVRKNDVKITRNGNLVLYRRIVSLEKTDKKFTEFVSQQYFRIKGNKKSPKNYWITQSDKSVYHLVQIDPSVSNASGNTVKGNLYDLYTELPNLSGNVYTSAHNKGKLTIKIGGIYKIPDSEINLNNDVCHGGGLHAAAVDYNYSGYGDTPVVVLLNPSKAITVPKGERAKLRTTEMFIAAVNDKPHGVHWDEADLAAFDEEYHDLGMEELEEVVRTKSFDNLTVSGETPDLTYTNVKDIADMLRKRVQTIV